MSLATAAASRSSIVYLPARVVVMRGSPVNELGRLSRGPARLTAALASAIILAPTLGCGPAASPRIIAPKVVTAPPASESADAALGIELSKRLGVAARLPVRREKTLGAWTFTCGRPVTAAGAPIDYASTTLHAQAAEGPVEDQACALLEKTNAGYLVRELSVGDTDAPFVDWPPRYGIPEEIIALE